MPSFNQVTLFGNVTHDIEVKFTPKGTAVAQIGMAINRNWTTESGEKREEVTFVDIELWGRTAEIAGDFLKKGEPVMIAGRLQLDTWDDKQSGQKRSKLKVVGEHLVLLGQRDKASHTPKDPEERGQPAGNRRPLPPRQEQRQQEDDGIPMQHGEDEPDLT